MALCARDSGGQQVHSDGSRLSVRLLCGLALLAFAAGSGSWLGMFSEMERQAGGTKKIVADATYYGVGCTYVDSAVGALLL
jgi:uncharacterized membrane protein YidH (DUF202 family)